MTTMLALLVMATVSANALAQEVKTPQDVKTPQPGVPEIFTIKGEFVRIAYNNEGYVSLGYRTANQSAGEEWMLLEMGITLRDGVDEQRLERGDLSVSTPDNKMIPLATQKEFNEANLQALNRRAGVVRDSINYFPPKATRACRIAFFAEISKGPKLAYDSTAINSRNACVGRVFFKVPGGIQYGQHFLNVQFDKNILRVPFYIMTEEEEKMFRKNWKDIKKEHEKAFKKK
jgi:hypothetical protein